MKKRFVWLGAACVAVIGLWFGLAFRPAHSQLGEIRDDVAKTKQEVSALEAKVQKLLALQGNDAGAKDRAQRLVGSLPSDPQVPDFILKVQDAANAAGIDFLSVAPSLPSVPPDVQALVTPPAATNGTEQTPEQVAEAAAAAQANPLTRLRSISVQIKADGEYFEIEDFTLKMERLARALRIDDFTLSVAGEGEQGSKLSASIKLQMFMMVPQGSATAAPAGQTAQGTSEGA